MYERIVARLNELYVAIEDINGELDFNNPARFSKITKLKTQAYKDISDMLEQHTTWLFIFLSGLFIFAYNNHSKSLVQGAPSLNRWDLEGRQIENLVIDEARVQNDYKNDINHWYDERGERNSHAKLMADINNITDRIASGKLSQARVSKEIQKAIKSYAFRERRIIRTSEHRIVELAHYESATNLAKHGYYVEKEWNTMEDDRVRDNPSYASHVDMDKQREYIADPYILVPYGVTQHPGASGIAEQDINCRCWNEYIIVS